MGLVQIVLIWGAASAALFPSVSQSSEWDDYKELKAAMVRSSAKRDLPLPSWVSTLDKPRPVHWYWLGPSKAVSAPLPEIKQNVSSPVSAPSLRE